MLVLAVLVHMLKYAPMGSPPSIPTRDCDAKGPGLCASRRHSAIGSGGGRNPRFMTAHTRGGVSRLVVAGSACLTPVTTPRPSAPGLPVSEGLCPAPRLRDAGGFHGLASRCRGALGSAVDQGRHGPKDGVVPRHVWREDTPRGGQDLAKRDTSVPLGRDPCRLESEILAVAGEGSSGRTVAAGCSQSPARVHRSSAVVWPASRGQRAGSA